MFARAHLQNIKIECIGEVRYCDPNCSGDEGLPPNVFSLFLFFILIINSIRKALHWAFNDFITCLKSNFNSYCKLCLEMGLQLLRAPFRNFSRYYQLDIVEDMRQSVAVSGYNLLWGSSLSNVLSGPKMVNLKNIFWSFFVANIGLMQKIVQTSIFTI